MIYVEINIYEKINLKKNHNQLMGLSYNFVVWYKFCCIRDRYSL